MVEILTLCEYASEHEGRLTIIDTFDAIRATKFPWRAYFYVATKIGITKDFADYKTITLKIFSAVDPNKIVFETSSKYEHHKDFGKINLIAGFKGLIFESAGDYFFHVCLDNDVIAECLFKVVLQENV